MLPTCARRGWLTRAQVLLCWEGNGAAKVEGGDAGIGHQACGGVDVRVGDALNVQEGETSGFSTLGRIPWCRSQERLTEGLGRGLCALWGSAKGGGRERKWRGQGGQTAKASTMAKNVELLTDGNSRRNHFIVGLLFSRCSPPTHAL